VRPSLELDPGVLLHNLKRKINIIRETSSQAKRLALTQHIPGFSSVRRPGISPPPLNEIPVNLPPPLTPFWNSRSLLGV